MTGKPERARSAWWWKAGGIAGSALVAAALALWTGPGVPSAHAQGSPTSTPTDTATPTATPTPNTGCILNISKSDSPSNVPEGGQIVYTITVDNEDGTADCTDLTVTDTIPRDTDCVSATVSDAPSRFHMDIDGCDTSGDVTWDTSDNLKKGDEVVLKMTVQLTSGAEEGDDIKNKACADSTGEVQVCDTETTNVTKAAATSTPTRTATPVATIVVPSPTLPPVIAPPPPPVATLVPIAVPPTGSGPGDGGSPAATLALALGLAGGLLLAGAGVAAIRMRRTG